MKIQYEEGDLVFERPYYGGESFRVTKVNKLGVTVANDAGETFYLGKHQVEPHPGTVADATYVQEGL